MTNLENVYRTIKARSNFIINHGEQWSKEISSAKNFITTPDLKYWTFGKSAGLNNTYHSNGGAAKRWQYSIGFINILELPNNNFNKRIVDSFLKWAYKVKAFDIVGKFNKDQSNNKNFEILIHNSLLPKSLLKTSNISNSNQTYFNEGFKKQITREVAIRDRKVIELAKIKYGTKCEVCKFDFGITYGAHGIGFIEMHHLFPIYLGKRKTTIEDLRPLCANCHRMIHKGNALLSIEELKSIIKKNNKN